VSAATPGQAAYEAYCRHVDRISPPPWEHLHSGYQEGWERVAQAGHEALAAQEPHAADELAALADEMYAQAQLIAPASTEPDGMPDMADQIRAEVLHEYAGKIRAAIGLDAP